MVDVTKLLVLPSGHLFKETHMDRTKLWNRRAALQALGAGTLTTWATTSAGADEPHKAKGNIKQSVCQWCYGGIQLETLAAEAAKMGYKSIELLSPEQYKVVKPFGLTC